MNKFFKGIVVIFLLSGFYDPGKLSGVWEYAGGVYNGKPEPAPATYSLQRKYSKNHYEAYLLEKGEKPEKYEAGNYILKADTCLETQTFSAQESKTTGITIQYKYDVRNDTLVFDGVLPNGTLVHEYWKKVK